MFIKRNTLENLKIFLQNEIFKKKLEIFVLNENYFKFYDIIDSINLSQKN